jgi:hypothetical protein
LDRKHFGEGLNGQVLYRSGLNDDKGCLDSVESGHRNTCTKEQGTQVQKKRRKCIKRKAVPMTLVLGGDVCMHKVVDMASKALVGRLLGIRMGNIC